MCIPLIPAAGRDRASRRQLDALDRLALRDRRGCVEHVHGLRALAWLAIVAGRGGVGVVDIGQRGDDVVVLGRIEVVVQRDAEALAVPSV